jgi:aminoglycoside phosphotransferase (APT) family kinase protein
MTSEDKIEAWIRDVLDASVSSIVRHPRWRNAWEVTIETVDGPREIYVRGAREGNYVGTLAFQQEANVYRVLRSNGIPVPQVFGIIPDPFAMVMEKLPGRENLATLDDEQARETVRRQYVETLARMHAIPLDEFTIIGIEIPQTPASIATNLYRVCERVYTDGMKGRPFVLMEFIWSWMNRNVPEHRTRRAFLQGDAGQFLFDDAELTGIIDFEHAYIGDPAAEFAAMRMRDSVEPLGDISALVRHYEELTGDSIDRRAIDFHLVGFSALVGWLLWPLMHDPEQSDDYIVYTSFAVRNCLWSIEAIAQLEDITLDAIVEPRPHPMSYPAHYRRLVGAIESLTGASGGPLGEYERSRALSLAYYAERWNLYGPNVIADDLADASALLGAAVTDTDTAEQQLSEFAATASGESEHALIRYLHRWLQRRDFLLRECGDSSLLGDRGPQAWAARDAEPAQAVR